jgi:hypothetical protein
MHQTCFNNNHNEVCILTDSVNQRLLLNCSFNCSSMCLTGLLTCSLLSLAIAASVLAVAVAAVSVVAVSAVAVAAAGVGTGCFSACL